MRPSSRLALFVLLATGALLFGPRNGRADDAPKPEIKTVEPKWITSGERATLHLTGVHLAPTGVQFTDRRIIGRILKTALLKEEPAKSGKAGHVKSTEPAGASEMSVEVEVTSPAELKPDLYAFKLLQAGADSLEGKIFIDQPLPEVEDKEPNDSLMSPQMLPPGSVAVRGNLGKDGVDVFQFQGRAGETWRVGILAHRIGSPFEPVLRIRDPRLAPVRAAVDEGNDCSIEYTLPMDGPYLIEVFDGNNGGNPDMVYRLSVVRLNSTVATTR